MVFPTEHSRCKSQEEFCVLQLQIFKNKVVLSNSRQIIFFGTKFDMFNTMKKSCLHFGGMTYVTLNFKLAYSTSL